jgi:KaiC/GvpD/RAD55 family RecA-like ATPase
VRLDGAREDGRGPDARRRVVSVRDRALALGGNGVRLRTGIATLDAATRGGLLAGGTIVFGGAPGAGKTMLAVTLADRFYEGGHPVAILAADEYADGLLIRLGQRRGLVRDALEAGHADARAQLAAALDPLRLLLVDQDEENATLEDVADRLARLSTASALPGVLVVDSIQTVRVNGGDDPSSPRERIDRSLAAVKRIARVHGFLVIVTSEMARGFYRGGGQPATDPLAAFKESGGIEYGATLALALAPAKDDPRFVDVVIAKNRLGQRRPFRLAIDFARSDMREVTARPQADPVGKEDLETRCELDVEAARAVLVANPGIKGNDALAKATCTRRSMGKARAIAARKVLEARGEIENRGTKKRPRLHWNDPKSSESSESSESPDGSGDSHPSQSSDPLGDDSRGE